MSASAGPAGRPKRACTRWRWSSRRKRWGVPAWTPRVSCAWQPSMTHRTTCRRRSSDCARWHPEGVARALDAARAVGLDVAGIDIVAADLGRPLEEQGGVVVAVDAQPDLGMHTQPAAGPSRPVGEAIMAHLFGAGQTGRIPIVVVTGVNGKTTTT